MEERTMTIPFDIVVRNEVSRYYQRMKALRQAGYPQAGPLIEWCQGMVAQHQVYTREHLEDMPDVRDWVWTDI